MDRNNTKSIVANVTQEIMFANSISILFPAHLTPLPNKEIFFLREYMFHSPQSSMLATLSSLRVFQQWALAIIQAPSRLCLFLPCQCPAHGFTLLAPVLNVKSGKETNVIMCLQWMRFICNLTAPTSSILS